MVSNAHSFNINRAPVYCDKNSDKTHQHFTTFLGKSGLLFQTTHVEIASSWVILAMLTDSRFKCACLQQSKHIKCHEQLKPIWRTFKWDCSLVGFDCLTLESSSLLQHLLAVRTQPGGLRQLSSITSCQRHRTASRSVQPACGLIKLMESEN